MGHSMKRTFIRLLTGYWVLALGMTLLLFLVAGAHQLLSDDPSVGDGYGFALAFLWLLLAAPWPAVLPLDGMLGQWILAVGMLLNSLIFACWGWCFKGYGGGCGGDEHIRLDIA